MKIITKVTEMREEVARARSGGLSVGLVPTMGALHEGHASLIRAARAENGLVVTSVFVNPTQFGPTEDLAAYPRDLEKDAALAREMGTDVILAPAPEEMYPNGVGTWVEVTGPLSQILCGRSRPTHFRGVTTVVAKLFNIVLPDRAYFGQKDGQQVQVVQRMVDDLMMPVEIRIMPIIREADGLALSSRNAYLTSDQRRAALVLSRALTEAGEWLTGGRRNRARLAAHLTDLITAEPEAEIDYVEILRFPDLTEPGDELSGAIFIALAVRFGRARLIDNRVYDVAEA